jgi:hypothetical protein
MQVGLWVLLACAGREGGEREGEGEGVRWTPEPGPAELGSPGFAPEREEATEIRVCPDGTAEEEFFAVALEGAPEGARVVLCGGRHAVNLSVERRRLEIVGEEGAVLVGGGGRILRVAAGSVLTLRNLTLEGGVAVRGGALSCEDSVLGLESVELRGNRAESGGALYARGCAVQVEGSRFTDNAAGAAGDGGGALLVGSVGTVRDSLFVGNQAHRGGGLAVEGGGMRIVRGGFTGNNATRFGGGAWLQGEVDLVESRVEDNAAVWSGGGVFFDAGSGRVTDTLFAGNTTQEDGAGAILWSGTASFIRNVFRENVAEDDAGGLRLFESRARVEANSFEENVALHGDGGAVKVSHAVSSFRDNTFTGNRAGGAGGGVEIDDDNSTMDGDILVGNQARGSGGAIHTNIPNAEVDLQRLWIVENEAGGCGGGVGAGESSFRVQVRGSRVEGNRASRGGGLCWLGALPRRGTPPPEQVGLADGVLIAGNAGGGVYVGGGNVGIAHVTLFGNTAALAGSALLAAGGSVSLGEALVGGHAGTALSAVGRGSVSVEQSLLWGNERLSSGMEDPLSQRGNAAQDPLLLDAAGGDFRLGEESPARDAGREGCLDRDFSRCDLGWSGGAWGGVPW